MRAPRGALGVSLAACALILCQAFSASLVAAGLPALAWVGPGAGSIRARSTYVVGNHRERALPVCYGKKGKRGRGRGKSKGGDDEGPEAEMDDNYDDDQFYAPRVSSNINIPVRHQIRAVRKMKELMKQESRPAPTKVKVKKKEAVQRRAMSGTLPDLSPEFLASRTILLVDGYNVISKWRVTLKARSAGGNAQARSCLAEQLRYLVSARRWKCIVAYDEHTPGSVLRVIDEADVEEVFTGESMSADSYIEKKAKELVGKKQGTVMVATDDREIQLVSSSEGAQIMSTSRLIQEIYIARKELILKNRGEQWPGSSSTSLSDADDYFD